MEGANIQLDVGLDIQGIVEHAFHQYDTLTRNNIQYYEGSHEAIVSEGDVHSTKEIWPSSGQAENVDAGNIARMPCEPDSLED